MCCRSLFQFDLPLQSKNRFSDNLLHLWFFQAPQSRHSTLRRPLLVHSLLQLLLLALQQLPHRLLTLNLALAQLLSLRRNRSKKVFTVTTKSTSSKNEMMHALLSRPPRKQSRRRVSYIISVYLLTCRSNRKLRYMLVMDDGSTDH
jgi:hypothetical protein